MFKYNFCPIPVCAVKLQVEKDTDVYVWLAAVVGDRRNFIDLFAGERLSLGWGGCHVWVPQPFVLIHQRLDEELQAAGQTSDL